MEDHGDPDLWEDHKRTLKPLKEDWPGELQNLLITRIEKGKENEGKSVEEILLEEGKEPEQWPTDPKERAIVGTLLKTVVPKKKQETENPST